VKKGHLKYTNDKKRNKKDNKRNFTKDAGRGAHGVYCSGGGGGDAEFEVTPLNDTV